MNPISIGCAVPDFELPSTGTNPFRLTDCRGQLVVLYFYPKDNTPGCTQEAQAFRDDFTQFNALNTVLVGVSRDSLRVHEGFKTKQALPFELLADTEESLCHLFDVIKQKSMYGKQVRGIERSTFILNTEGVLVREWRKVKVKGHSSEVLQVLRELTGISA
ncbi:MAG: peroxiredoxin [Methylovulum sp.]|jgi:peroxiredoxin Q/BCP|nr:peroxiredoxin [Methylovulum sp.]MCF7997974.1 peroxiredoxin [Methylovulum sp.]